MAERVASFVFQDKDWSVLSYCEDMSVKVMLFRDKRVL